MKATYDPVIDALHIVLADVPTRTRVISREVAPALYLEEARGQLVGIEILDASTRVPRARLLDLASPEQWLTMAEAAAESGLAPQTLRAQIANGRLPATKRGRDWSISLTALTNYLESRDARGRPPRSDRARRAVA